MNSSSIMPLPPSCCWWQRRRSKELQCVHLFVCMHRANRYVVRVSPNPNPVVLSKTAFEVAKKNLYYKKGNKITTATDPKAQKELVPVTHYSGSTLMSLLPTAMPISARSFSSDDIISVTLFL